LSHITEEEVTTATRTPPVSVDLLDDLIKFVLAPNELSWVGWIVQAIKLTLVCVFLIARNALVQQQKEIDRQRNMIITNSNNRRDNDI
jgi:hypothetical protein